MQQRLALYPVLTLILSGVLAFSLFLFQPSTQAQQDSDAPIQFTGAIQSTDGNTLLVSGLTVRLADNVVIIDSNDDPSDDDNALLVGTTIAVSGVLEDGIVLASTINVVSPSPATATPTGPGSNSNNSSQSGATSTPQAGQGSTRTSQSTPQAGQNSTRTSQASSQSGQTSTRSSQPSLNVVMAAPLIVIEGPVSAINVDSIQIFNFSIQVDASDPVLTDVQVGDYVRVEGEASFQGNLIVIVAITIVEVNITNTVIGLPGNCRVSGGRIDCSGRGNNGGGGPPPGSNQGGSRGSGSGGSRDS